MAEGWFTQEVMKKDCLGEDGAGKLYDLEQKEKSAKNSANIGVKLEGNSKASEDNLKQADASREVTEEDLKLEENWMETCAQGLARKDKVVKFCWGRCDFHGRPFADTCSVRFFSKLIESIRSGYIYSLTELVVNFHLIKTTAQQRQFYNLLETVTPTVQVLSMYNIRFWLQPYSKNTDFLALRNLELRFRKLNKPCELKQVPDFLLGFVQRAPTLKNLSLKGTKMMGYFVHIMDTPNCRNVESLFVSSEISNRHFLRLAGLGLHLKALCLEVSVSKTQKHPIKPTGMKKLLQSISAHLEELVLQGVRESPKNLPLEIKFSPMPKLKTLGLLMYCPFVKILNFSLATQFPVLKNFHLTQMDPDRSDFIFDANIQPATSVEALALSCPMDASKLLCIVKMFPNLKKLAVEAAPNLLESLTCTYPDLDDLNLMFNLGNGVDADSIFTEYSPETCNNMKAEADVPQTLLPNGKQPMNVLLDLKTLTLATSGESLGLTDNGCHMVLQKFPHLRCLKLWGKHGITDSTIALMREKFTVL